ncbi:MAG: type II toxin-antitoxin system prevent-host-death family antitoxin [Candidatus Lambdaproteobacteria bacterium]|nr:type II toxin-antitoxin system prevent-host-death family antitoxin [Candidatus Lambdaproteobacteria bacterium]
MPKVNVTELRQRLPGYLKEVRKGTDIQITVHGRVIARLVGEGDEVTEAKARLAAWRKTARIGDVETPVDTSWEASDGRL